MTIRSLITAAGAIALAAAFTLVTPTRAAADQAYYSGKEPTFLGGTQGSGRGGPGFLGGPTVAPTPEPASLVLIGTALTGLYARHRSRKNKQ